MSALLQDAPEVLAAYETFKRFSADPVMQEKARVRRRFLEEQQILLSDAWEEGKEEGKAEGRAEGKAEGKEEGKIETARNMKARGLDNVLISEITGLPLAEIERLE